MSDALTTRERREWALGTKDIATNARGFVSVEVLAMNRRRYEATLRERDIDVAEYCLQLGAAKEFLAQAQDTLQAKDTTIAALVEAAEEMLANHGWVCLDHLCPTPEECDCDGCVGLRAAIKEATNGS